MRLFRLGLWIVVVAMGCKQEEPPGAGALRVDLSYATFRPGCLTLTVADSTESGRTETQRVELGARPERSRDLTVAVFRKEGWSRQIVLTATAYERSCTEHEVATQTVDAVVPEEGVEAVTMDLRAEDLDDDGYVKQSQGGTDCNDGDGEVNPGATEVCDGQDDNCSGDEADAPDVIPYYADEDGDGYGDPGQRLITCTQPARSSTNNRDCDDNNPAVHPDQDEPLCNGKDENCDDVPDDTFSAGDTCSTALGCVGAFVCTAEETASACVSSQSPTDWYVDGDGDTRAGTFAGMGCVAPVPGAVNLQSDCDDSSPFAFNGGTEVCDLLDNDCDGQVDEVGSCPTTWSPISGAGNGSTYHRAVAAYAEGKAWVAGLSDALVHVQGSTATAYTGCSGSWASAWARPSDGRVFLGSNLGIIATRRVSDTSSCETTDTGAFATINGMVGFENGASTTLFAVTSNGRIYQWIYTEGQPLTPSIELARVGTNLRSVHGTSPTNLLAVGAEDPFLQNAVPRVFRFNPNGGAWIQESLPAGLPSNIFLRGVHMVHDGLAYAAGDKGVVLERSNGTWVAAPQLRLPDNSTPDIQDVAAYGRTVVYAAASNDNVYRFDGTAWIEVHTGSKVPRAIDGVGPHDLWVAGDQGSVIHWGP